MIIELPKNIEESINSKVQSGLFPSMDAAMTEAARLLLERIDQEVVTPQLSEPSPGPASPTSRPIWERILERTAEIPDEVWDQLPTDLADQHDHNLYGTPKRPKE